MSYQSVTFELLSVEFTLSHDKVFSKNESFVNINKEYKLFAIKGEEDKNAILIPTNNNISKFQLLENKTYYLKTSNNDEFETPLRNVKDVKNTNFKKISDNIYTFNVQGFLGSSYFSIKNSKIIFEIIPQKIDYETDFQQMTDEISKTLSQLLQNWSAPTSLHFISDSEKYKKTLLEQYIFLKHFVGEEKLNVLFEIIKRDPNQKLKNESEWAPTAKASYANYIKDPIRNGRDWQSGSKIPNYIFSSRKFISFDTIPNQFIKFALKQFAQICNNIIDLFTKENENNAVVISDVGNTLDAINTTLNDRFFLDISDLYRIPFDNQVLQKKFGYKEILNAWLMVQLALSVNWTGRESAYSAATRNVAKLYEYWLFFKLIECLEIIGLRTIKTESKDQSIKYDEGGLNINLMEGKPSVLTYSYKTQQGDLRVHLYFNKTFAARKNKKVTGINSYSQQFRPDYSLVLFPKEFEERLCDLDIMEENASANGCIAYLHFDAKYRVDKITELFDNETDLNQEDIDTKIKGVYKRGDLYKMHTYNDAIKRTVGSYVLYPGDITQDEKLFEAYHEILPGVGAFAVKPGNSLESLSNFIRDCLNVQSDKFSQLYRMQHDIHTIVKENPLIYENKQVIPFNNTPPSEIKVALGYCRSEDLKTLVDRDYFYFHAIGKKDKVKDFPLDILQASILFIYTGGRTHKKYAGFYGVIESIKLLHKSQIVDKVNSNAEFYYYVKLKSNFQEIDLKSTVDTKLLFEEGDEVNSKMIHKFLPAITTWDKVWR